ncbi:Pyruvate phosphate dikinase, PEP/pyruvate-binding domain protein [Candidatus Magnetobacterium bavaricum]|uniref:Pyruvate phosphate dikinase, PEP/pyruvate-binding domain protein n=1 Tax=Candidatus Magnetobacterium bavaricum TaxID=29290 RepID=A0A0F3GY57_9BACT|nr:Pyruvate phosphate dikinase, PEP/pyruvate-binding domain protein [Candidatus Magnetobacterium bavaricum]
MTKSHELNIDRAIKLVVETHELDGLIELRMSLQDPRKCILHWGLCANRFAKWQVPPEPYWPQDSVPFQHTAIQSSFQPNHAGGTINIKVAKDMGVSVLSFVLFFPEENRWDNNHGKNYQVPIVLHTQTELTLKDEGLLHIAERIIHGEMGNHSWTLMHRFNLCHDLCDGLRGVGFSLLFVWLRYSFLRQLDWQRNYNTQPRELSHSVERLTLKLAEKFINEPDLHEIISMMMTTLGAGGDGQRIRDEILQIMHRHRIKEVTGHFLEEWHQKLHNNTTADDIAICEAYIEFLRSNGNLDVFFSTLMAAGINRERLAGFERPIKTPPDFVPHLKDALLHDFGNYLNTLKSVHSGTDLYRAVNAALYLFDHGMQHKLHSIVHDRSTPIFNVTSTITEVCREITRRLDNERDRKRVRDLLFLSLALEEHLRIMMERNVNQHMSVEELTRLIAIVVENILFTNTTDDLRACSRHLGRLSFHDNEWRYHCLAILERLKRLLGNFIDRYYRMFHDNAQFLGKAFNADAWTVNLFTEEVIRTRLIFALSLLLQYLETALLKQGILPQWQVISPHNAVGMVEVVDTLHKVTHKVFDTPTIIVTDKVVGDEEIPKGVTAIISANNIDVVSHLGVRARNGAVLFATCYNQETIQSLKALKGRWLNLLVTAAGEISFEESEVSTSARRLDIQQPISLRLRDNAFETYALTSGEFSTRVAGLKSNNLVAFRDKLPNWIHTPASVVIPFGIFDHLMRQLVNADVKRVYDEQVSALTIKDHEGLTTALDALKATIMSLNPPGDLFQTLTDAMQREGISAPDDWTEGWRCIKQVYASAWNERAYLSRRNMGIPHEGLSMAVLIQGVIEAEYAFVIHTLNPITNNPDELYAEVVLGLGETLVGNFPGRALSFTCNKADKTLTPVFYPSKGIGLYGGGLIFRSDTNAEDLMGYAGAGLYDSILLPASREVVLNYADEALLWDKQFQEGLMRAISEIGITIENIAGSPQDIEGVYSKGAYYVVQSRAQML